MLTVEVHQQLITWPEDFAVFMMMYYQKHGIPFILHINCIHSDMNSVAEYSS
jgi:hypothetical protein